jgi:hypothetical protein
MNIDDKSKRLRQLKMIHYPSDQDLEEMEKLEDEIKISFSEVTEPNEIREGVFADPSFRSKQVFTQTNVNLGTGKGELVPIPKQSLLRKILRVKQRIPERPVTFSELEQLKMVAQKEELLTKISKAKAQRKKDKPSVFETIQKVIGKSTSNPFDMSPSKKDKYDPWRW